MKAANNAIRQHPDDIEAQSTALMALGFSDNLTAHLVGGYADFELSNNRANIRRMKARVAELIAAREKLTVGLAQPSPALDVVLPEGVSMEENTDDNRLRLYFPGKPDEATRTLLRSNGWRWSSSAGAWQRQLTDNARANVHYIADRLAEGGL